MTRRVETVALCVALVVLVWVVLHLGWYRHGQIVDYPVYRTYGDDIVHHDLIPYRDFRPEYPPAALVVFALPSLLDAHYNGTFQVVMAVCALAATLGALALGGLRAAVPTAVAPLLLGSLVLSRFDLWPAALAILGVVALVRRRHTTSAVLLGTAFAAKLWPVVLVPLALILLWRRVGRRPALAWLGVAAATAAVWFLPFVALSPAGVAHSFHEQLARPLQIESFGASVLIAMHHLVGSPLHVVSSYGSQNLAGPGAAAAAAGTSAVAALCVVAAWLLFAAGEPTVERLLVASATAIAALIAFGKVFSPQFLLWLVPFVPLGGSAVALTLYGGALVLTQVYFPERYWRLIFTLAPTESWIVFARDLAVVGVFVTLVYGSQRAIAASRAEASSAVSVRSGARTSG